MSFNEINKVRSKLTREGTAEALAEYIGPVVHQALMEATKTCITCDHFDQRGEVCNLYNKMRPPAKIIAFGCDSYENEIPF